jgi:toxin ParE1/3/4
MSENYNVVYSSDALDDLRDIYSYIAIKLKVPDTALNQINHIRKEISSLNFMPMRFAVVDWEPWKSMGVRKALADKYAAFYTVDDDRGIVTIARIFYGGQDIENIVKSDML